MLTANWGSTPVARAQATLNNPPLAPHSVLVFAGRSFVSAAGFGPNDVVRVDVLHRFTGAVVASQDIVPKDGVVEVNHPGGGCWLGTTPDIRPGDRVRTTATNTQTNTVVVDETSVADVTVRFATDRAADGSLLPAGTVQVHGTARDADGLPLPVSTLEQRLLVPGDAFALNGRRTLRATSAAGSDGTLSYDPAGSTTWTATYAGLSGADISRALGADSRAMWLGDGSGVEGTIFEQGAGVIKAPSPGCNAPLEVLPPPPGSELVPPSTPQLRTATVSGTNTVDLTWTAATDNAPSGVTSYGVFRNGVALSNVAGSTLTYRDVNVPAGTYTYTVDAGDEVGNRSAQSNGLSATATLQPATDANVHQPPVVPLNLIAFPSRDFVSTSGFLASDRVSVQVIRNGFVISTASGLVPQDDPSTTGFDGVVEVNHPGGGCWEGVTPDLRPGDHVRTIASNPDGTIRSIDQTTVANLVAERPTTRDRRGNPLPAGTVQIHGLAMDAQGKPIPAGMLNQRLVAPKQQFDLNHKRTLRAAGGDTDGTFAYDADDPTGTHWTVTYAGLTTADVTRALSAESRIMWLGATPLVPTESTIYENGDGTLNGPTPPCLAPSEPFDTAAPSRPELQASDSGAADVQLTWTSATDNVGVFGYGLYRDGVRVWNVGASTTSFIDRNVSPGGHSYAVDAVDSATPTGQLASPPDFGGAWGNRSGLSNTVSVGLADTVAPTIPHNLVATASGGAVTLAWSPSSDDVAVAGYRLYRGGVALADVSGPGFTDSGLAAGTYSYTVDAVDAAGNRSAQSAAASVQVSSTADRLAPSVPGKVTASVDVRGQDISLTWNASTDNAQSGVTSYGVYRNGVKLADVARTELMDANRPAGTYSYTVDAVDSAGNRSAQSSPAAVGQVANEPPLAPHFIQIFPSRDFVSASGYLDTEGPVTLSVIRNGVVVSTSQPITPVGGLVEVNHPGGGCWLTLTPDIRPGDVVRLVTAQGVADQTTTANVVAQRAVQTAPDTMQVHGTAQDASGKPLALDSLQQRLVSTGAGFAANGRKVLRASSGGLAAGDDGVLAYDGASTSWTATYTGLSAADIQTALAADSRVMWLGSNPLAVVENTVFEIGTGIVGGPSAPCTAPAEAGASASVAPASLSFADQTVGTSSPQQAVTLTNTGTAPLTVASVSLSGSAPGDFTLASNGCATQVLAPGNACTVNVRFVPTTAGARGANLVFQDDAPGGLQGVSLSGHATPTPAAAVNLSPTSLSFGNQQVGTASNAQMVTLTNTGTASLSVTGISFSDAGDFQIGSNGCSGQVLGPNAPCSVGVVFKPTTAAPRTANLVIQTTAAPSPFSVALSGTGIQTGVTSIGAPSTPDLAAASDSGASNADNLTNVTTPTFTGSAAAGATVSILVDGVAVGSGVAPNGTYAVQTSALGQGAHSVTAVASSGSGTNGPPSGSLSIRVDTTPPTVGQSQHSLASPGALTLGVPQTSSSVPVRVTWSATETNGVDRYEMQQSTDNGLTWTPADAPGTVATTLDLKLGSLATPASYRLRVRATDVAGNVGDWTTTQPISVLALDDAASGNQAVAYSGNWQTGAVNGSYFGTVHSTTARGPRATLVSNKLPFASTGDVAWVTTLGPDRGQAQVTVDGGAPVTVDLYAPTEQAGQIAWATSGLPAGAHTITVTALGTRNSAATGTRVDVDAVVFVGLT